MEVEEVEAGEAVLTGVGVCLCLYSFYFVVDLRLVPAVRVLCNRYKVPDDVAGATILGAALNAPELFTAMVTGVVQRSEVGVGVVAGSWNFNVLLITAFSALAARSKLRSRQLRLSWTFLQRDVYAYALSVLTVVWVTRDQVISWPEALAMFLLYLAYVGVCYGGSWCQCRDGGLPKARRRREVRIFRDERGVLDFEKTVREMEHGIPEEVKAHLKRSLSLQEAVVRDLSHGPPPEASTPLLTSFAPEVSARLASSASSHPNLSKKELVHLALHPDEPNEIAVDFRLVELARDEGNAHEKLATDALKIAEEIQLSEEEEEYRAHHLLAWPSGRGANFLDKLLYVLNFPFNAIVHFTIPVWDEGGLVFLTVLLATCWLAAVSWLLGMMSTRFGKSLGIPPEVVGLTLDAAGTSFPNLLAAVMASRSGKVDTAICQAFGSNTFDALVAFGLVQGIRCSANGFRPVPVQAEGFALDGIIDIAILVLYVLFLCIFRMRLTRSFGWLCLAGYLAWLGLRLTCFPY